MLYISTLVIGLTLSGRQLSQSNILNYNPSSKVTDHNRVDLDQKALEDAFGSSYDFQAVGNMFTNGAHSRPTAVCTFKAPSGAPTVDIAKKEAVTFTTVDGAANGASDDGSGSVGADYTASDATIKMNYPTSSERVEPDATQCYVGGLETTASSYNTKGCVDDTAKITIDGNQYDVTCVNTKAGRTLQGFSTKAKELMYDPSLGSCKDEADDPKDYYYGCPYTSFVPYFDYYCSGESACKADGGYVSHIVEKALTKGETDLANGNMNFKADANFLDGADGVTNPAIKQVVKKGTSYLGTWMYVIREFEDAIDDCTGNELTNNDLSTGSVHAWDEGVAFYVGSLMEPGYLSGAASDTTYTMADLPDQGKQPYTLANKRCTNFKTCGLDGDSLSGEAKVNIDLWDLFNKGQYEILTGDCGSVVPIKDQIVSKMTVPLVQGTLRYAWKMGVLAEGEDARAEGAIFAAGVLPQVHACDPAAAATIYDNVNLNTATTNFTAVKLAFEGCYAAMNISCAEVGGLWYGAENKYYKEGAHDAAPCVDPVPDLTVTTNNLPEWALIVIIVVSSLAFLALVFMAYMCIREKKGKPIFTNLEKEKNTGGGASA
jgi:hypothetical protein